MEKIKEILRLIMEILSVCTWFVLVTLIPYSVILLIGRVYGDSEIGHLPMVQQVVFLILVLWMMDIMVRPVITKILNVNIDRFRKVMAWQPLEKKEGISDARCKAAATKDA